MLFHQREELLQWNIIYTQLIILYFLHLYQLLESLVENYEDVAQSREEI
jgi:hypothetical protein